MSKKLCPSLHSESQNKIGQGFLDTWYIVRNKSDSDFYDGRIRFFSLRLDLNSPGSETLPSGSETLPSGYIYVYQDLARSI